jgi:hypothetical protein
MNSTDRELLFKQLDDRNAALAKSIDYEQLERDGLLIRHGDWYRVLKSYRSLPDLAKERIVEIALDEVEGLRVRFEG